MHEFLKFVVSQLVDWPEAVIIHEEERGSDSHYSLTLPASEVGKVIGKQGHTIQAIRSLLSTAADRNGKRAFLEVAEQAV